MFTPSTSPALVLLVIMSVSTATARAHGSYFFRRFLIKLLPVFVMPARTNGHTSLPIYICSSIISPSSRTWSFFTITPSCFPEPHNRAYFSLARKSLWTDSAASSSVLPRSRIIGSLKSGLLPGVLVYARIISSV